MNLLEHVLLRDFDALGLAQAGLDRRLRTTLLTPRFPTSRHVVALVFPADDARPRAVAKVPRLAGDDGGVHAEAAVLRRLASLASGPVPGVPAVLGTPVVDGRTVLVETAVQGRPLDPARVVRDPGRAVRAATTFLAGLPVVRAPEDNLGWYEAIVEAPLAALAALVPLDAATAELCARTHAVLRPLRDAPLPAVFEHGDLSHPNLFLTADGESLLVIDWERATDRGLPGHDLAFYLHYVSQCRGRRAGRPDDPLTAFDDAFVGPGAWALPVLEEHLSRSGVDPSLAGLLVVATWARTAGTLVSRLGADRPEGGGIPAAGLATAVAADRDVALWRRAVERAEEGRLG